MLVRDLNRRMDEEEAPSAGADVAKNRENKGRELTDAYWAQYIKHSTFCAFPDLIEPQRMPSMFPIPTHIIRRQKVTTLSLPAVSAGSTIYGIFRPETWNAGYTFSNNLANSTADMGTPYDGIRSDFIWRMSAPGVDLRDNTFLANQGGLYGSYGHLVAPSVTGVAGGYSTTSATFTPTNVGNGGVRLIGSYIEIEYVGTAEQHSGMIECALRMHNAQHLSELAVPMFMDDSEIVQGAQYKKFKPVDGIRCVWFPIDNADYEFTNYATDWRANQVLDVTAGTAPVQVTDATAFTNSFGLDDVSNAFGPLKKRVYPQWCINISGLQVGQPIRISVVSYYETVPDDFYRDIFMPKKTREYMDPARSKATVTALAQHGIFATPAKSSGGWSRLYQGLKELVAKTESSYLMPAAQIGYGIATGNMASVASGVGSMMNELF